MSGRTRGPRPSTGSIVVGVLRLARGRADGLHQFAATREAFLASLAPLVAFPLVGGVLMLLGGGGLEALTGLLATLCAVLAPPVLSYEVARFWGREQAWPRFATAFNWCQWVIPVVGSLLLVPIASVRTFIMFGLAAYALWLHWFLARHGLGLSRLRAALLVIGVNVATVVIVVGPQMLTLVTEGSGPVGK
jgi:hypothetical protein